MILFPELSVLQTAVFVSKDEPRRPQSLPPTRIPSSTTAVILFTVSTRLSILRQGSLVELNGDQMVMHVCSWITVEYPERII
jgi:hypothetical protein